MGQSFEALFLAFAKIGVAGEWQADLAHTLMCVRLVRESITQGFPDGGRVAQESSGEAWFLKGHVSGMGRGREQW